MRNVMLKLDAMPSPGAERRGGEGRFCKAACGFASQNGGQRRFCKEERSLRALYGGL